MKYLFLILIFTFSVHSSAVVQFNRGESTCDGAICPDNQKLEFVADVYYGEKSYEQCPNCRNNSRSRRNADTAPHGQTPGSSHSVE